MHPNDERDRSLEILLRQELGREAAAADACVDAETLAAWSSGSLAPHQATSVERHVSSCARCQTMVAAFVRTEPPAAPRVAWIDRWQLRWLVPLATAATVAAIWVAIPDRDREVASLTAPPAAPAARPGQLVGGDQGRRDTPAPEETRSGAPPAPVGEQKTGEATPRTPQEATPLGAIVGGAAGANANIAPLKDSVDARAEAPRDAAAKRRDESAREADRLEARQERFVAGVASPAAPPPPPARAPAAQDAGTTTAARPSAASGGGAGVTGTSAKAPERPREAVAADQAFRRSSPEAQNKPAPAPASPAALEAIVVSGQSPVVAGAVIVEIASPDPASRWRVIDRRRVEQSADGGSTWQPAALTPSVDLLAGHAPAATVCWIVGRDGAAYVTSDGTHFEEVPFVERVDVVKVVARSDREATITTADGRAFRTTDRGATWTRVAGLQENL